MIETGTLLQERYLVEKQIGAGGMGAVYLAVDRRFDNYVAIKETFYQDEEFAEAFEREGRILNALQHPVLPHVSDYFAENNKYFLVMQFIEGEDLSDIIKRDGAFPAANVLYWTDSLLDALDYMHTQEPPVIHRDIKPHNLKLTPRGDIMLLDFGLAKLNYDDASGSLSVFGFSRTYSPLEQIQGTGTDARSDIFALGATVYHLLTGKPPVDALTRAAAIVNGKPDPIQPADDLNAEIPKGFANLLNSALALNPEQRFVSAKAMRQALEYVAGADLNAESIENNFAPAVAGVNAAPVAAKNENFPALEAFAQQTEKKLSAKESDDVLGNIHELRTETMNLPYRGVFTDAPTQFSKAEKDRKPVIFAVLATLILGAATAFYLAGRASSPEQNPVAETAPPVKNSSSEVSEKITPENGGENKTKPVLIDKTAEKRPVSANSKTSRIDSAAPRPKESVGNGETRERIVGEPQPTDSMMDDKRERSDRRKVIIIKNDMSEEEFKRLQRESKQKRWDRRKRPLPF